MKVDTKIVTRLQEMLEFGDRILATKREPPAGFIGFDASVDTEMANQWATQCKNILLRIFGESSPHYQSFAEEAKELTFGPARRMQGVLRAAIDDYQNEYLFDVKRLIAGDGEHAHGCVFVGGIQSHAEIAAGIDHAQQGAVGVDVANAVFYLIEAYA